MSVAGTSVQQNTPPLPSSENNQSGSIDPKLLSDGSIIENPKPLSSRSCSNSSNSSSEAREKKKSNIKDILICIGILMGTVIVSGGCGLGGAITVAILAGLILLGILGFGLYSKC